MEIKNELLILSFIRLGKNDTRYKINLVLFSFLKFYNLNDSNRNLRIEIYSNVKINKNSSIEIGLYCFYMYFVANNHNKSFVEFTKKKESFSCEKC